jgi:hypothetical protein
MRGNSGSQPAMLEHPYVPSTHHMRRAIRSPSKPAAWPAPREEGIARPALTRDAQASRGDESAAQPNCHHRFFLAGFAGEACSSGRLGGLARSAERLSISSSISVANCAASRISMSFASYSISSRSTAAWSPRDRAACRRPSIASAIRPAASRFAYASRRASFRSLTPLHLQSSSQLGPSRPVAAARRFTRYRFRDDVWAALRRLRQSQGTLNVARHHGRTCDKQRRAHCTASTSSSLRGRLPTVRCHGKSSMWSWRSCRIARSTPAAPFALMKQSK